MVADDVAEADDEREKSGGKTKDEGDSKVQPEAGTKDAVCEEDEVESGKD